MGYRGPISELERGQDLLYFCLSVFFFFFFPMLFLNDVTLEVSHEALSNYLSYTSSLVGPQSR